MSPGNSDAMIPHSLWQPWPMHSIWTNWCCRLPNCADFVWNSVSVDDTMVASDCPNWCDAVEPIHRPADRSKNDRQFLCEKNPMHTVQPAANSESNRNPDRQLMSHVHSIVLHLSPNDQWYATISYRKEPIESIDICRRTWHSWRESGRNNLSWELAGSMVGRRWRRVAYREKKKINYLIVGAGAGLFVIDVLLFFFSIGGLLVLSLLDDDRFVGSALSMSCTFRLMYCASGQCLATLCNNAVVDDVLNRPSARRRNPWLKHASTAAHSDVTEPDSSWTNFRVTASSIICFTSFLTAAISRSLKSMASAKTQNKKSNWNDSNKVFFVCRCIA